MFSDKTCKYLLVAFGLMCTPKYKLVCHQLELLEYGGTLPISAYNDFYVMRIEDCKVLAHVMLDEEYVTENNACQRIPDADMRNLYQELRDNLSITQNYETLVAALADEEKAWFAMMQARLPIYYKLYGMRRSCFANATNRIQQWHAKVLKHLFICND